MLGLMLMTALAAIAVAWKLKIHLLVTRVPLADGLVDLLVSGLIVALFAGTMGGAIIGVGAGLVVSLWLFLVRWWHERFSPRSPRRWYDDD